MQTRHRIPTVFNISMVDVLCCALGCVILMWLLKLRDATGALHDLEDWKSKAANYSGELADWKKRYGALEIDLSNVTVDRDRLKARTVDLDKLLAALRLEKTSLEERLTKKTQESDDLGKKLTTAAQRVQTLETLSREKETLANSLAKKSKDLEDRLTDADARLKKLQAVADRVPGLEKKATDAEALAMTRSRDLDKRKDELDDLMKSKLALERDLEARGKELTDARGMVASLQDDKRKLTGRVAAAENRFAGIELTGRRVVFLVDRSGSMKFLDEKETPAPGKWKAVADAVAKIMRSLPELEKFQVITFAENASYLIPGRDGQWFDYDPKVSPDEVVKQLVAVEPKGGTNMYAGLDASFRLRAVGLDTVYLISDGLPSEGGISDAELRQYRTTSERSAVLGRLVRNKMKAEWNPDVPGRTRVRINAVGFFFESPDVGAFLWALARENDGSFVGMSKP